MRKNTMLQSMRLVYIEWKNRIQQMVYEKMVLPYRINGLKKKDKINVAFIMWNPSMWKSHCLYKLMEEDPRYKPFIILIPSPGKNCSYQVAEIEDSQRYCMDKGYSVYPVVQTDELHFNRDLVEKIDILFPVQSTLSISDYFSFPYIYCYIPYGYTISEKRAWSQNSSVSNMAWLYFSETEEHISQAAKVAYNHARNRVCVGYIFGEELEQRNRTVTVWKKQSKQKKRIIWAPHFSLEKKNVFHSATFLDIAEDMLILAQEYRESIQMAFKPHPYLYNVLCKDEFWGKEKTDSYYKKWETMANTQLETGIYQRLFLESDALIHDSGAFTVEYLYTHKPVMYVMRDGNTEYDGIVGNNALDCHYIGFTMDDIKGFITNVVINGQDDKRDIRETFYNKYLISPNGITVAENIIKCISNGLS